MRPLRFPQGAPNRGLTVGAGVAQGLNSAMANYFKMRQQNYQMQTSRMNAQANMQVKQANADAIRLKSAGSDLSTAQLLASIDKTGHFGDKGLLRSATKDKLESFVSQLKPEERQAATQHIESQLQQGQLPSEIADQYQLNQNQLKFMGGVQQGNVKQGVAQTVQDAQTKRTEAIQKGMTERTNSIQGRMKYGADLHSIDSQMKNYSDQIKEIRKPTLPGSQGMDPQVKQHLEDALNNKMVDLHSQRIALQGGGDQAGPSAVAAAEVKKPFSWDQRSQAAPGDSVADPSGKVYQVHGRDQNGKLLFAAPAAPAVQTAQRTPQMQPTPSAAPQPSATPITSPMGPAQAEPNPPSYAQGGYQLPPGAGAP